ncbi:MAG: M48 family metalloprotease [Pseudomonadota bacterium]|jgi:predicted Zn-dependent protease|nr:MAG: peptidase M48 [Pseudomonadota bacterium]
MDKLQNRTIGRAARAGAGLVMAVLAATLTIFGATTPVAAQGLPLIRDTEIENLLNDYARPIFKAAGLGEGRVAVRIVRSDIFNAFVLDGRNVFIHTGALMQAETPNQIIGVIAHEAGHIAGGHLAALRSRIARDQTRALLIRMLGLGVAIATGAGEAVFAGDELIMRSLLAERRSQEAAADQAGLRYLNATRQSGRGMLETFERFAQQEYVSDKYKDPFVRSHPVASDRLARLRELVESSPYYHAKDPPELQLRHDMMRAKLAGYLERPQVVFNRYPRSDTSLPARYARAIATFMQGGQNALPAALQQVDALIRERPDNPYFYELKADFLTRSGKSREAIAPLREALRLSKGASLIRVQLASALLATNDPKVVNEAADLLRKAIVEDENPRAYRSLADAYYRLGRQAEADAAIAQAYFLEGDVKQAQNFATRAQRALRQGSPTWLKMDDIINYKSSDL